MGGGRPRPRGPMADVPDRTIVLDVARVSHVVARDKLTFAALGGREHVVDYTLAQLEERLDSRRFPPQGGGYGVCRASNATACAAIASPAPTESTPSFVFPLTLT